jgi:hypothetical protein
MMPDIGSNEMKQGHWKRWIMQRWLVPFLIKQQWLHKMLEVA